MGHQNTTKPLTRSGKLDLCFRKCDYCASFCGGVNCVNCGAPLPEPFAARLPTDKPFPQCITKEPIPEARVISPRPSWWVGVLVGAAEGGRRFSG